MGAEFLMDARVDVIAAMTVQVGEFPQDGSEEITLQFQGSQDQCLQYWWSDGDREALGHSEETVVLAADGSGTQYFPSQQQSMPVLHVDMN
jgi:hypothetical protein